MPPNSVDAFQSDGVRITEADNTSALCEIYPPLAKDSKQFRLLHVWPGKSGDTLRCDLGLSDLSDGTEAASKTTYETISYCWGDPTHRDSIVLNGYNVDVPSASAAALRRVRLPDAPRIVWIDAVCINQGSNEERSQQVAMMGSIYRNGQENLVYFGDGDFEQAIEEAKKLVDQVTQSYGSFREFLVQSIGGHPPNIVVDTLAMSQLYINPWFSRVWTFQEAVLSARNTCLCGSSQILLFEILQSWIVTMASGNLGPLGQETIATTYQRLFGMFHFLAPPEMIRDLMHGDTRHLLNLIDYVRFRRARDLRDHVYGVLGLATGVAMVVDYNKDASQIFKEAAVSVIEESQSLEMLRFAGSFQKETSDKLVVPSWVPQWHSQDYPLQMELKIVKFDADARRPMASIAALYADDAQCVLRARGIRVGLVLVVHSTRPNAKPYELRPLWSSHGADTLARVLTCADKQDELVLQEFAAYMQGEQHDLSDETKRLSKEYYSRIVSNKHRMFTTQEGHLGLGSDSIMKDDIVCIIYGLSWPAVLRPVGDRYRFIGVAYVSDMMNGEVVQALERSGQGATVFEIC